MGVGRRFTRRSALDGRGRGVLSRSPALIVRVEFLEKVDELLQ